MAKIIRSFLFVPADSEKKLAKAGSLGADALILDLEDAVLPANKAIGRMRAADFLKNTKPDNQQTNSFTCFYGIFLLFLWIEILRRRI